MKKNSFIPSSYRPKVPGSKLRCSYSQGEPSDNSKSQMHRFGILPELETDKIIFISAKDDIVPKNFLRDIDND